MDGNHEFVPPKKEQLNPPQYSPSKIPILLITFLFISLLIIFGVLILLFRQKTVIPAETVKTPTPIITNISFVTITPLIKPENPLIIYLRDGNLWSVRTDGTSLIQLTRDADPQSFNYTSPIIKKSNEIIFGQCIHNQYECTIKSKNLDTGEEKVMFEPKTYVSAYAWDKNTLLLVFIASQKEGVSSLYFYENGNNHKVLDFAKASGRGGGLGDEISLNFSPDGRYLLVVNTTTQPNASQDPNTLWLFDQNGNTILIKEATNAIWESNASFLGKKKDGIYRYNLAGREEKIADILGYNFTLSPDKKKLLYWSVNDDGTTAVSLYDLNTKVSEEIKKNLGYPKWTKNSEILAVKTNVSADSYYGFTTNGLIVFNLETKEEHLLDSNSSIFQFIIQI